uniref:Uncharacterized protein n=1 Tax=Anguilla anguilla TaxID=7936 RepID=A0A0E9V3A6_ANGAN
MQFLKHFTHRITFTTTFSLLFLLHTTVSPY